MNGDNILLEKTYKFAIRIVKLHQYLLTNQTISVIARQLIRSGTSIGANCEESNFGQSRKDFVSKLSIALKEAKESHYWLRLLRDTGLLEQKIAESMLADCEEIIKLLVSIIKTSKKTL